MAEAFDYSSLGSYFGGSFGIPALTDPPRNAKLKVFGTLTPEGFDSSYLNSAAQYSILGSNTPSRLLTESEYEKAFQKFKDDPSDYYKFALKTSAGSVGHTASLYDYYGGQVDPVTYKSAPEAAYTKIATEAFDKGYLDKDEILSLSEPAYQSAYSKQSGYNNPDLRGGGGFLNKTLNSITSNPVTLFAVPLGAAALSGAFAGAGAGAGASGATVGAESSLGTTLGTTAGTSAGTAGATDFLGSQALGSASTGAVGSGATGVGLSAGSISGGAAAGTGLNAGALGGMGYLGGAGNLAVGTAGLTAEQIAQAELAGQIGSNASSGLGYLGGAESLPSGTAGITGVTAPTSLSLNDIQRGLRLGQTLLGGQQQPAGQPQQLQRQVKPTGGVDYSPILNLLALRQASTPNVYSLLG